MHLTAVDLLFWVVGFLGHSLLLVVLWSRGRARSFPVFTALITTNLLRSGTLLLVRSFGTKADYFYTYWSFALLDVFLQLCVVYELAHLTFRPLGVWARDVRRGFSWLVIWSIAIAAGLTWLATPSTRLWMQSVMIQGSFFSASLVCELFVGMTALSVTVGLPWKTHATKIAGGLAGYSMLDVLVEAAHSHFGLGRDTRVYDVLSSVRKTAYLVCLGYWIIMLWREAPAPREMSELMRKQLLVLQGRFDRQLEGLRSRRN